MTLTSVKIHKQSPFLGEACALCKELFSPGEEIIICPDDATRHHTRCWIQNGNKCTAYGCQGRGELYVPPPTPPVAPPRPVVVPPAPPARERPPRGWSRRSTPSAPPVPATPAGTPPPALATPPQVQAPPALFGLAQSCLVLAIAITILLVGFSCFGLWAIADYVMLRWLDYPYRPTGVVWPLMLHFSALWLTF